MRNERIERDTSSPSARGMMCCKKVGSSVRGGVGDDKGKLAIGNAGGDYIRIPRPSATALCKRPDCFLCANSQVGTLGLNTMTI